jgi:iron(III) transport system substrate-binding protein
MTPGIMRLVVAIGLLFVLSSVALGQSADWARVVAAAKSEGKLVIYNTAIGAPYFDAVLQTFEDKYEIEVEVVALRPSELRERIRVEQAAGRFLGDVEQLGRATMIRQEQEGALQPHGGFPNLAKLRREFRADGTRVPGYVQAYGILVNTDLAAPADRPTSWKDLLDPKWKGKILSDDVRALGGGQIMFAATYEAFGREFHEKLAKQKLIMSRDLHNDARRVARGEQPIYIPMRFADEANYTDLPVKIVVPTEGCPYVRIDLAVLKNAPHPNAARLFINYFLEAESQLLYANHGLIPVVQGVIEQTDAEHRAMAGTKLLGTSNPEQQKSMIALANKLYK